LGAIGGREKDRDKDKAKDLSDVLRRVGAPPPPASARGFEIYVDPADDPEIGEIVIVKRKKSRAALESV
jgi:serine/arginine repetitive matrix protein 2